MPGIELSTLNADELRSLLHAARRREHSTLADDVAAELSARSTRPARWAGGAVLVEPEDRPRPRTLPVILGVGAAAMLAIGVGWQFTQPEPRAPEPILPVVVAPPTPLPTPAASAEKLEVLPRPGIAPSEPLRRMPAPSPPAVVAAPSSVVDARPLEPVRAEAPAELAPVQGGSWREQRLRLAYERALEAGVDPRAIDRGQARWRQRLARTRDPDRRSALYARRIGELEAAARWNGGR